VTDQAETLRKTANAFAVLDMQAALAFWANETQAVRQPFFPAWGLRMIYQKDVPHL